MKYVWDDSKEVERSPVISEELPELGMAMADNEWNFYVHFSKSEVIFILNLEKRRKSEKWKCKKNLNKLFNFKF